MGENQGENGGKHPNLVREIALVLNNLRKSISLTGTAFKTMGEIRGKLVKGDLIQLYICEIALVLDYPKKNIYLTQVLVNVIIEDKYDCLGGGGQGKVCEEDERKLFLTYEYFLISTRKKKEI